MQVQRVASTADAQWKTYQFLFGVISVMLLAAPVSLAAQVNIPYDRICEVVVFLLVATCLLARARQLPQRWMAVAIGTTGFMLASIWANSQLSRLFHPTLVLLDAKILLCIVAMWAFGGPPLEDSGNRRRLARMVYLAFVVGVIGFGILNLGTGRRLQLLDESNYMMLALIISSVVLIDAYQIKTLSPLWLMVIGFLGVASFLAQSRTGFATVGIMTLAMLWTTKKRAVALAALYVALLALLVDGSTVLDSLTRGQTDIREIDRFVFLNELWQYWSHKPILEILFGNNVGVYLSERTYGMHFWVGRLSAQHGIPFGLAPFDFHSFILRLPLDIGLVPALALSAAIYVQLRRTCSGYVVLVLFISCLSMSVFYLSTVMPFIVLAQLLRPAPVRQGHIAPNSADSPASGAVALSRERPAGAGVMDSSRI